MSYRTGISTRRKRTVERRFAVHALLCTSLAILALSAWVPSGAAEKRERRDGSQAMEEKTPDLHSLYRSRHFFTLRERLAEQPAATSNDPRIALYHATIQSAFNRPADSNKIIKGLLDRKDLPRPLELRLLQMELENDLRLGDYGGALGVAEKILTILPERATSAAQAYARRMEPLLEVLKDTPPQTMEKAGFTRLALGRTRRIPLEITGQKRRFALDTGANFSVIMRSEAEKLGLKIRPAGLQVSTSTTNEVVADVAVADDVVIGKVSFKNVVFLVFPDEDLSFPGGERIPGLVGFPIVNAMDEVRFRRDDVLEIPHDPPTRTIENLALDDLDPLVRVRYTKDQLLCRLDTGAAKTDFYEPFFRRYRERIEGNGKRVTTTSGGVGGYQEFDAYRLARLVLTIAGAGVTLRKVEVFTQPIRPPHQNYLDCNVGLDALEQFPAFVLNFRDMALILE